MRPQLNRITMAATGIAGTGIDHVECARVERSLNQHGSAFIRRIAHAKDLEHAPNLETQRGRAAQYWASRFAVKEAFAKALGTGIGASLSFRDIGVDKDQRGKPLLVIEPKIQQMLEQAGLCSQKMHLSLSHTSQMAIAIVILEYQN